jgi:hypothetical protein
MHTNVKELMKSDKKTDGEETERLAESNDRKVRHQNALDIRTSRKYRDDP